MEQMTKGSEIVQVALECQEREDVQTEQRGLRTAFGAMGMLRLLLDNHPELAPQMAIDMEHLIRRYGAGDPSKSITVTADVPPYILGEWVKCYDVERAEVLLLQAMQEEIEKRKQKLLT